MHPKNRCRWSGMELIDSILCPLFWWLHACWDKTGFSMALTTKNTEDHKDSQRQLRVTSVNLCGPLCSLWLKINFVASSLCPNTYIVTIVLNNTGNVFVKLFIPWRKNQCIAELNCCYSLNVDLCVGICHDWISEIMKQRPWDKNHLLMFFSPTGRP